MHAEILRALSVQRGREMRERAHRAMMARVARRMLRAMRRGIGAQGEVGGFVVPAIPRHVDDSYHAPVSADGPGTSGSRGMPPAEISGLATGPVRVGREEQRA